MNTVKIIKLLSIILLITSLPIILCRKVNKNNNSHSIKATKLQGYAMVSIQSKSGQHLCFGAVIGPKSFLADKKCNDKARRVVPVSCMHDKECQDLKISATSALSPRKTTLVVSGFQNDYDGPIFEHKYSKLDEKKVKNMKIVSYHKKELVEQPVYVKECSSNSLCKMRLKGSSKTDKNSGNPIFADIGGTTYLIGITSFKSSSYMLRVAPFHKEFAEMRP